MAQRRRWLKLTLTLPLLLLAVLLAYYFVGLPLPGPAGVFPQTVQTQHFRIHYTTRGVDRASPAFARRVGQEAENALTQYHQQGFRDPFGAPPWQITLQDLGEDDLGIAEGWPDAPTRIVLSTALAAMPVSDAGGLPATIAHELFHGIQAAYVPDLDRLPDFLVEGTPDACAYAVLQGAAVHSALLVDSVAYYTEEGRLRSLSRQQHAAAGYFTVLADRFGGPGFCRGLLEQLATADANTALARLTGLPEERLQPVVALRLYGEYVWRADELGKDSPLPPDPEARFDVVRPPDGTAPRLQAGATATVDTDSNDRPLRVRPLAVSAISLDRRWRLPERLELTVQAGGPVAAFLLVGSGAASRLADYRAVAVSNDKPIVLEPGAASRLMLLVLRPGSGAPVPYRVLLRAVTGAPTPLQPLPALLQQLEAPGR